MVWLRVAYVLNILILIPVCASLFVCPEGKPPAAMEGKFTDSVGLRMLLFSLWSTVLLGSVCGLLYPFSLRGLLVFQVVYKSIFLVSFVRPRLSAWSSLPAGLISSFVMIVLLYPLLLWRSSLN